MRTQHANKGKPLQNALDIYHRYLRNMGLADITERQVASKVIRGQQIFTKREGFDYQGCIKGGRCICIEAKQCSEPTLRIDPKNKNGLRLHQLEALVRNHRLGALVGVVWMMGPREVYVIAGGVLDWAYREFMAGRFKSFKAMDVRQHEPNCVNTKGLVDYLDNLKAAEIRQA